MAALDRFSSASLSMARTLSSALGTGASITASRSCSLAAALESMSEIVNITKQLSAGLEAIPDVEQLQVRRQRPSILPGSFALPPACCTTVVVEHTPLCNQTE